MSRAKNSQIYLKGCAHESVPDARMSQEGGYGEYGDGPNMINHKENTDTYTYLADAWEITKRALAGKIRQYDKDQLWDATHALAAEWVPTDIGTLEAFKTKSLDRFDMTSEEHPGLGHLNGGNVARYTAFENINQLVYRANAIGVLDSLDPKDET